MLMKLKTIYAGALLGAAALLTGCTTVPTGPSTLALPGTGRPFDQFQHDDGTCRQYAYDSIGGQTATRAQEDSGVKSAVAGAVIGALIGGAVGGGHGAAVGAGVGVGAGAIAGVGAADASGWEAQRRYDQSYVQCMYGKGHKVAVSGRFAPSAAVGSHPPPRPTYYPPPARYSYGPPPVESGYGYPPPPPPGSPPPPPSAIVR